jgi:hypothetical protein
LYVVIHGRRRHDQSSREVVVAVDKPITNTIDQDGSTKKPTT